MRPCSGGTCSPERGIFLEAVPMVCSKYKKPLLVVVTATLAAYGMSVFFGPELGAWLERHFPNLESDHLREHVLLSVLLILCFALAVMRGGQLSKLESKLLKMKDNELVFQERAINEHAIVSISNPDGRILEVNDKFMAAFGYAREEILGQSQGILYADNEIDQSFEKVKAKAAEGKISSGEQVLRTKSGEIRQMQCTVVPLMDTDGNHIKNISVRTDVTAARRSEALEQLTSLLDRLQDLVLIFRPGSLDIIYANKATRDWFVEHIGWDEREYLNRSLSDESLDFNYQELEDYAALLGIDGREAMVFESTQYGRTVEVNLQIAQGGFDEEVYIVVVRDITERKEIEQAKREFVAVVSHELRTPLTAIKGSLGLLRAGVAGELPEKAVAVLDVAYRNSERLLHMVNDMLDLEKIEAGKMDCALDMLDLTELLREALLVNKGYGDEYEVHFRSVGFDQPCLVRGNEMRLLQVMTNLMSNAAKFSPRHGVVTIRLSDETHAWRVSVSDDGPGISEDARETIFEKFRQAEAVDGKSRKGTGLGLSIVKAIVERHGGTIGVTSEVGRGTTFFVDLPKLDAARQSVDGPGHLQAAE
jgi:two-component system, OmpR family, sensor histidine kinase VicK